VISLNKKIFYNSAYSIIRLSPADTDVTNPDYILINFIEG